MFPNHDLVTNGSTSAASISINWSAVVILISFSDFDLLMSCSDRMQMIADQFIMIIKETIP